MKYTENQEMIAAYGCKPGEKCRSCKHYSKMHCTKTKPGAKCPPYGEACEKFETK